MSKNKVIITGAKGRMGQALISCAGRMADKVEVVAKITKSDDLNASIAQADVVIDFSYHDATPGFLEICAKHKKAIVIGTTGFTEAQVTLLKSYADKVPIVWASNFSTGVNALFYITRKAAEILGPDFDLEVIEMHHRLKKDAPSGTARTLGEILAEVRSQQYEKVVKYGREGLVGERPRTEIGMHSLRGGDVVGDNSVIFANVGERLELGHKASSRDTFANGALRAAQWLVGKKPGIYDMQNVLGLK